MLNIPFADWKGHECLINLAVDWNVSALKYNRLQCIKD